MHTAKDRRPVRLPVKLHLVRSQEQLAAIDFMAALSPEESELMLRARAEAWSSASRP